MSTKRWAVEIPIVGTAYAEVEAETEQEAIDAAMRTECTWDDIQFDRHIDIRTQARATAREIKP